MVDTICPICHKSSQVKVLTAKTKGQERIGVDKYEKIFESIGNKQANHAD